MEAQRGSIMERLQQVHDPRRREGKRYNMRGLLGMLLLGAVHGEESLRGMWLWGCHAWERIAEPLDMWGTAGPPSYGTVWGLLARIDATELGKALWAEEAGQEASQKTGQVSGCSLDGKALRGSKRGMQAALAVVTLAGHDYRTVLGEQAAVEGDLDEAAISLLKRMPLAGKLVSMDAGLLHRGSVKVIEKKGGPTSGL
jgi:hypothetical protein